ncbi:ion transporter [Pseudohalocynthiibacter aestuariivivens]|uniref:Ion transporter n=1 Tax=Pseudohalocynthiibacter aestuariivivens TaxID=1591409 RepID=A0ABV5JBH6_9RHOB|nr:ion transporter [Pseudohalocynthiibacter aestuariivivens]MCK0101378.1 ion transporter [Pseudohalocynthiibacter sp. F2068]
MRRHAIVELLDGTHERWGNNVALALHSLIVLSAIAIALETVNGLPPIFTRLLYDFEVFILLVFVAEYVLRLTCSKHPVKYAFSFWGIIDLMSCLPAIALLQPQWQVVRTIRLIRLVRLLKLFRTSVALDRLGRALTLVKGELIVFGVLSALMLYVSAVGIYLFEHDAQPDAFSSIPQSLWWAVASFTTVGYGDLFPITTGGRIFTSFVLFIGLGIVAVPSAIITAALLETQNTVKPRKNKRNTEITKKEDPNETS